jgi:two-component system KDP operon response regulator KdpE
VNSMDYEQEKKRRILVVDDQPKVLRFIEIALRVRGFEVTSTTSGEEALELAKSSAPDIMLLDIIMPGLDGFEVLKNLRSFTQLPVVAFSATAENRDRALLLGANDFINKPFYPDELVVRITAILQS